MPRLPALSAMLRDLILVGQRQVDHDIDRMLPALCSQGLRGSVVTAPPPCKAATAARAGSSASSPSARQAAARGHIPATAATWSARRPIFLKTQTIVLAQKGNHAPTTRRSIRAGIRTRWPRRHREPSYAPQEGPPGTREHGRKRQQERARTLMPYHLGVMLGPG